MHTRLALTAACVAATGLFVATPWAHAEEGTTGITTSTPGPAGSSGVGTSEGAMSARAGAVTLGQVASGATSGCSPGPTTMAQYLEGGAPSYVAPTAGVITGYSVKAGGAGLVRLVVFGPSATAGHRTVIALSAQNPVVDNTVNTFPTRVPIAAGLSIGLNNSVGGMTCYGTGVAGDQVAWQPSFDPGVSTDFPGAGITNIARVNISAVLEPDVDGDQFGDVSQDLCPQSKLTQAACPAPDTKVTKQPKKRSAKRKATIKFTSTIAGSTFTCVVDGKAAKPCTSPYKKRFKVGKHTVVITATSAVGIVDPTPATAKFKVTKPKT